MDREMEAVLWAKDNLDYKCPECGGWQLLGCNAWSRILNCSSCGHNEDESEQVKRIAKRRLNE